MKKENCILIFALCLLVSMVKGQDYYLNFDSNAEVQTTSVVEELNNSQNFTFELKVKLDSYNTWTNLLSKILNNNNRIALQSHNGQLYAIVANGSNSYRYTVTSVLQLNQWHHIAFVYNGSLNGHNKVKLFLDGNEIILSNSRKQLPDTSPINSSLFKLGHTRLDGQLDEIRIWNVALSGYRINNWKDKPIVSNHPEYNHLCLYWNCNDPEHQII